MPAEIRQKIIEHLLPEIVDGVMEICPCLAHKRENFQKSCRCFKAGLAWDDPFRRPPSNIAWLHRPTLLVNRMLHADTVHVLSKLPSTVAFCSGPCLLAFSRCIPLRYRKIITLGVLKFSIRHFKSHRYERGKFVLLLDRKELERRLEEQIGYMLRARRIWAGDPPPVMLPWLPCLRKISDYDDNLHYWEVEVKLDVDVDADVRNPNWDPWTNRTHCTDSELGFITRNWYEHGE